MGQPLASTGVPAGVPGTGRSCRGRRRRRRPGGGGGGAEFDTVMVLVASANRPSESVTRSTTVLATR